LNVGWHITEEDLILSVYENTKELELHYIKLKEIATDGAPSVIAEKQVWKVELRERLQIL
jgi:hypothetical protein